MASILNAMRGAAVLAFLTPAVYTQEWSDSKIHETLLPMTLAEDLPPDHWSCVIANLTQYFDPPRPTGAFVNAVNSWADNIVEPCLSTAGPGAVIECWPSKEKWCGITSALPKSYASDASSWGAAASSWWASHSAAAVSLAQECPVGWYDAMWGLPGGNVFLNMTIIEAACYAEAFGTGASGIEGTSSTSVAKPGSTVTQDSVGVTQMPGVTQIPVENKAVRARGGIFN